MPGEVDEGGERGPAFVVELARDVLTLGREQTQNQGLGEHQVVEQRTAVLGGAGEERQQARLEDLAGPPFTPALPEPNILRAPHHTSSRL